LQAEQALKGEDDELLTSPPPERISNKDVSAGTLFTPPSPDVFPLVGEQSGLFSSGPDNRKPALIVPDDLPAPLTGNFPAENPLGGKTPPWADSGLLVGWDDSHFPEREPGVMAADIPAD